MIEILKTKTARDERTHQLAAECLESSHMDYDNLEYVDQTDIIGEPETVSQTHVEPDTRDRRADPRTELVTQASVSIPPLSPKAFHLREVSRSGMFAAFKDAATILLEIERAGIDKGEFAEVAFAVSCGVRKQQFHLRARIARISRQGIGLEFMTRNPPQLAGLRDLLLSATASAKPNASNRGVLAAEPQRKTIAKPSDTSGWQDWELLN